MAEDEELEGWLLDAEPELDWPLVAPAPAEPLVELELELGLEDAPPPALFFSSVVTEAEPEAEPEGEVVAPEGLELEEDEAAPEGEDGVVAEPEVAPEEDVPEGEVVVSRVVRFGLLSPQAARPRARETAAARMESFVMWFASVVGVWEKPASFAPGRNVVRRDLAPLPASRRPNGLVAARRQRYRCHVTRTCRPADACGS